MQPAAAPKLRKPTTEEANAIAAAREIKAALPERVAFTVKQSRPGVAEIGQPHTEGSGWFAQIAVAVGSSAPGFIDESLARIGNAASDGKQFVTDSQLNGAMAILGAINPQDELETILGEQIIASHVASMELYRRMKLNLGENIEAANAYANMSTKVSRTMAVHVETLAKLRSGGKQTHEVRYVYVNGPAVFGDGTQAVFGGGGTHPRAGLCGKANRPQVPCMAPALGLPLRSQDPARDGLPSAGHEGAEEVPAPRRQEPRRPQGKSERALSDGAAHPGTTRRPSTGSRRAVNDRD